MNSSCFFHSCFNCPIFIYLFIHFTIYKDKLCPSNLQILDISQEGCWRWDVESLGFHACSKRYVMKTAHLKLEQGTHKAWNWICPATLLYVTWDHIPFFLLHYFWLALIQALIYGLPVCLKELFGPQYGREYSRFNWVHKILLCALLSLLWKLWLIEVDSNCYEYTYCIEVGEQIDCCCSIQRKRKKWFNIQRRLQGWSRRTH